METPNRQYDEIQRNIEIALKNLFRTNDTTSTDINTIQKNIKKHVLEGTTESLQVVIDYLSDAYNIHDLITNHGYSDTDLKRLWELVLKRAKELKIIKELRIPLSMGNFLDHVGLKNYLG